MARVITVSIVLLLSLKGVYAQKIASDYIITKTGDTIVVKLKYNWLGTSYMNYPEVRRLYP